MSNALGSILHAFAKKQNTESQDNHWIKEHIFFQKGKNGFDVQMSLIMHACA